MAKTKYKTDSYPYQVYTALLTQSGEGNQLSLVNEPLTIGVTYTIVSNGVDDYDFTNVGAPNNLDVTQFVATGTTPNAWGSADLNYNIGAPIVTVLENTIGNIWWTFAITGSYVGYLPDTLLTEGKQIILSIPYSYNNGTIAYYMAIQNNDVDGEVGISTSDGTSLADIGFTNFPIEIRVYN